MSLYKKELKKGESLNDLCERFINLSQIENLIKDLILENYSDLINYEYLISNRFTSPKEQALKWLATSPFYIKKVSTNVIDSIFDDCIKNNKWKVLNTLLTITNSNGIGISEYLLEKAIEENIPSQVDLKLLFTLLNLEKQKKIDKKFIATWERRIKVEEKPYRHIILITIYSRFDPTKALSYFYRIQEYYPNLPERHIRQLFLVALRDVTYGFFDIFNSTQKELGIKVSYYIKWKESIFLNWFQGLIHDVFKLKKIEEIKKVVLKRQPQFLDKFPLVSRDKMEYSNVMRGEYLNVAAESWHDEIEERKN